MAVERPGQREWDGNLIDTRPGSGVWIGAETDTSEGWWPAWTADDLETQEGISPGVPRLRGMYPSLLALYADDEDALAAWLDLCTVGDTADLSWWSEATGRVYTVEAQVRRCEPREGRARGFPLLDVVWVVARPGEIVDLGAGS